MQHRLGLAARITCAASGALLLGGQAGATGYQLREQSALGQGTAFAGAAARADDPGMLFFNPAAMAGLPGLQGTLVGSGIFPYAEAVSATASRNALLGGSPIAGTRGGDIALDAFVPAGYATLALGRGWHVGLGMTAPWGLVTKSPADAVGRYHALTSSLRTVNLAPALAWQVTPRLALGAALQIQYATARLSSAVDFGAVGAAAGLPLAPGSRDGRSTVEGDDTALGFQLGLQWEPLDGTRLGLAFRSAIFHDLRGDGRFEGVPAPLRPAFRDGGAGARLTTPETVTLGLSQRLDPRWTLLAGLEWTNWSRFRDLVVTFDSGRAPSVTEERWRDSVFLSLGAEYRWDERLAFRAGLAWDQTPVPDSTRTPRIPDNDRYWLSLGTSYALTPQVTLSAAYTHIFAPDAEVNLADPGPGGTNLFRGNLNSNYRAAVDIFTAQLRFAF